MAETYRVLKIGGFAAHVFPMRSCLWEVHLALPVAHWIHDNDLLRTYIKTLSRWGLGKFKHFPPMTVDRYAELHADYIRFHTHYRTKHELFGLARAAGLRASQRYTAQLYTQKLRRLRKRAPLLSYKPRSAVLGTAAAAFLSRLSSVTLFLTKDQKYR
jgi:hypothetical protein